MRNEWKENQWYGIITGVGCHRQLRRSEVQRAWGTLRMWLGDRAFKVYFGVRIEVGAEPGAFMVLDTRSSRRFLI